MSNNKKTNDGILAGVVVLDLTQMLAGPYCTMILADHGADVIKIEPPHGDMSRGLGPYAELDKKKENSGYFHSINRNKRSIILNLKMATDREIFFQMVAKSDIVIENFRAGVMERLGLSYEKLLEVNNKLVYATIRGYGDYRTGKGPYNDWPAFDIVAQAMGGFMAMTGEKDSPTKAGPGIGDIVPGIMCAFGVIAALRKAEQTGQGEFVDVSMYDAMIAFCERQIYRYSFVEDVSHGEGNDHPLVNPFSIYKAADGWYAIGCALESQWQALIKIMGLDELKDDNRLNSNDARIKNAEFVRKTITEWTRLHTKAQLMNKLAGKVPSGPANNVEDIYKDEHLKVRDMLQDIDVPGLGKKKIAGVPVKFLRNPGSVKSPGPRLGFHTKEVMEQFGIKNIKDD